MVRICAAPKGMCHTAVICMSGKMCRVYSTGCLYETIHSLSSSSADGKKLQMARIRATQDIDSALNDFNECVEKLRTESEKRKKIYIKHK